MAREQKTNVAELRSRGIVKLRDEDMFALWVGKRLSRLNKTFK